MASPNFKDVVDQLTPEQFETLRTAVELGKWSDGARLEPEQLDAAMQAVILYSRHLDTADDEPFTLDAQGNFRTAAAQKKAYRRARQGDIEVHTEHNQDAREDKSC